MGIKIKGKQNKSQPQMKPGQPNPSMFGALRNSLRPQTKINPATAAQSLDQPPGKALGQALPPINPPANPVSAAAAQALQSPMSPPPEKAILPIPAAPVPPTDISPITPQPVAPAPQVVSPVASMQAQKDQMFPPAPATPVAPTPMTPPVAPKPAEITPPAGVTKSQADIDEEKKKLQAAGSPV